ncbi:MAG TPA: hypothetical protein PLS35_19390, partial [Nitrospira sp.]|nr:hypothetical protein [Nitrospira sp.]
MNQNRRATDAAMSLDIDQMILEEEDKKQRAFLIVLNSINKSLIANTETIKEVSEKLDAHLTSYEQHVEQEDALLNKGRGAWKVMAWVISGVQVIGLGIWTMARGEIKEIHVMLQAEQKHLAQLESRVLFVERVADHK